MILIFSTDGAVQTGLKPVSTYRNYFNSQLHADGFETRLYNYLLKKQSSSHFLGLFMI